MKIVIKDDTLGIEHEGKFTPAKGVIGHVRPDLDVLTAIWLFEHFGIKIGRKMFKSVGEGGLVEGKTASRWLEEEWILIDIGGENEECDPENLIHLDHDHSFGNNKCATSVVFELICSSIEVNEEEEGKLEKLVRFVTSTDLKGGQQFFDLSHVCKILNLKVTPEKLYKRISVALAVYLENSGKEPDNDLLLNLFDEIAEEKKIRHIHQISEQMRKYFERVENGTTQNVPDILRIADKETKSLVRAVLKEEFEKQINFQRACAEIEGAMRNKKNMVQISRLGENGSNKFLIAAQTDNAELQKAALYKGASIMAIENSKGQIQIFTQKRDGVNLAEIAAEIRLEELKIRSREENKHPSIEIDNLYDDGTIEEVPNWHLFLQGGMFLNGSHTAPDQIPTVLSLDRIIELIVETYN
jgi:hypothetical protein